MIYLLHHFHSKAPIPLVFLQKLSKGGSSRDGAAEDTRRGKRVAKDIPKIPVDHYSGRLKELHGRERGPIPASARARRSQLMANADLSSDNTENLRADSYESPESIDTETRDRLESELPFQQGEDNFRDDTSPEADPNLHTAGGQSPPQFNPLLFQSFSTPVSNDPPPFNVPGYSQMSDHNEGEGDSTHVGEDQPDNRVWRELTNDIDGGPTNPELLKGFLGHIAHSIWMGNVSHFNVVH